MTKYEKLTDDLKTAYKRATHVLTETDEGGCMNFDCLGVWLPRWSEKRVQEAAIAAGYHAVKWGEQYMRKPGFYIFTCSCGVGNRRSAFAEEITATMNGFGYDTHCYQESD